MSSFVINKSEYIKAAGLVSGLAKALQVWMYDYDKQRNMTEKDYYRVFSEFYTMNALSVQEQYRDDDLETDSNTYIKEFNLYKKSGFTTGATLENYKTVVSELHNFFDCCIYQTEKEPYMFKMEMFFNKLLVELMKPLLEKREGWGNLENCLTDRKVEVLF